MSALWVPALAVVALALAVLGAGRLCLRRAPCGELPVLPVEVWLWGLAAWVLALFALAAVGVYRPGSLVALVAASAVAGAWHLAADIRSRWRPGPLADVLSPVWATVAFLPLAFVFAVTVNPTVSWDGAVYHLTLPDAYLRAGGFRSVPLLVYGSWPHAVELFFGVAMSLGDYVAAKATHFGFGLLVAATLFLHPTPDPPSDAGGTRRRLAGLVAAALFLSNDVVLFELRAAYVELAMAFFVLAAYLLLERSLDSPIDGAGSSRLLVGAGLACGLLAGTKVNGIVTAAVLATLLGARLLPPLLLGPTSERWLALRRAAAFGLPVGILWLPWLARSWAVTGNPVYPLFFAAFGGPDWSLSLSAQLVSWQQSIGMGRDLLDWLLLPWRVLTAGDQGYEHFDGRLTLGWLAFLPLAAWRATHSPRARRALLVFVLLFLAWALGSQQMRFLIPALPLLALAAADGVDGALARWRRPPGGFRTVGWLALALWLVAFGVAQTRLVRAGWSHFRLYADARFERPTEPPSPPVFSAVSALPPDASVLLLNSNHLFYCRPTTCWADSFFEASQISDWLGRAASADEAATRLRDRGVSHLAWSGTPRGIAYPAVLYELLGRRDLARPVFADGPDRLWQLAAGNGMPATGSP